MQTLIILIGNIGSGKSTVSKKYFDKGYLVVSRDSVRTMFAGGGYIFNKTLEPHVFTVERYALQVLLREGYNVVVDETNVTARSRARLLALGQEYQCYIIGHVLPKLSKNECLKRRMKGGNRNCTKQKWAEVWELFDNAYKDPILKEGFDELRTEDKYGKITSIERTPGSKSRRSRD